MWYQDDEIPSNNPFQTSIPNVTGGLIDRGNGYPHCASVPITGPTSNVASISGSLFQFSQIGTGRFEESMAWAWRLLSPKWQGLWGPKDYPAPASANRRKIVVYLSDGRSSAYTYEMDRRDDLGRGVPSSVALEHLVEICREMKLGGIEIYMYQLEGGEAVTPYFKECASSDDHYVFINDDNEFATAFAALETKTQDIRLIR